MIIGFDAKRAVRNNTGLGNYSLLVVDTLARRFPENSYRLYTPTVRENDRLTPVVALDNVELCLPEPKGWRYISSIWRSKGIIGQLKREGVGLYHGLSNELPFGINNSGVPSVVTIHDLIFIPFPQFYSNRIDVAIYNYKFRRACREASRIIAVSQCTKRDIVQYYGIDPDKIDVVYQGCHQNFARQYSPAELAECASQYALPQKFVLYVGSIEVRKNLLLAVKALELLPSDIHLVAVGRPMPYFEQVKKYIDGHSLAHRVHFFHNMPFADLPKMYHLAQVFVYPSRYEGFGIPMLEAATCGTPAIGATGSCLEEACGPSARFIDPDNHRALADEIADIVGNQDAIRPAVAAAGARFARNFSHNSMADNIFATYEKVLAQYR